MKWDIRRVVLIMLLLTALANAQEYRGKVQGFVTDKTGAMVVGANIVLLNTATGVAHTTKSDESGHYIFDFVPPGNYTLTAELQGFSRTVQENIPVAASGDVQVGLALAVGAVSETITVQETPPALQLNSATIDTTVSEKLVNVLPVLNRNPFSVAMLEPSGNLDAARTLNPFAVWGAGGLQVGGTHGGSVELMVDGAPSKVTQMSGYTPNQDSVLEVVITQNSTDAERGFSGGGVISMVSKSGTNEWHGSALFNGRNPALNGDTFKYNLPSVGRKAIEAVSLGNPIRRNKLFTFNSFERSLWTPDSSGYTATMPTSLERRGDFSQSLTKDGALRVIYDPNTTVLNTDTNTASRQPFAGNKIPASMINPTSELLMGYLWEPNRTPDDLTGTNNFNAIEAHTEHYWNFMNRTDWNPTEKLKVYGHYASNIDITHSSTFGRIAEPNYYEGNTTENHNITGAVVYSISPSVVLDIRATYGDTKQLFPDESTSYPYADWSQKFFGSDWGKSYYADATGLRYPLVNIGGKSSFGLSLGWQQYGKNWAIQPKIVIAKGKHYMKVGVDFRQTHLIDGWPVAPSFGFGQDSTAATFINPNLAASGDGYASFLLGGLSSGDAPYLPALKPRDTYLATFFQDDLKLTSRIMLNLGFRLDKDTGPTEEQNRISTYADPNGSLPELAAAGIVLPDSVMQIRNQYGIGAPTWQGGLHYATSSDPHLFHPKLVFSPRVGAAIKIDENTSLRLAYARWAVPPIYTLDALQLPTGLSWGSGGYTSYGYYTDPQVQGFVAGKPTSYINDPFPAGLPAPTGNSLGTSTQLGSSLIWNRQAYHLPINDRFNVSLQHQFPNRIVADATFLYSYGSNIQGANSNTLFTNYNIVDPRIRATLKSQLDASVPNPFYNILTPAQFPGDLRNYPTVAISQLIQPYPYYTTFQERDRPGLHQKYRSVQLKATRPLVNGVQVLAAYAYDLDKIQQFVPNTMDEFLNTPAYVDMTGPRHRLNVTTYVELPFGRGRKFVNNLNQFADLLLGGWNFAAIYMWRSGAPLAIGDWTMTGLPAKLENYNGEQWFNANAFAHKVDPYALRTTPLYISGLNGPRHWNIDSTLSKQFRIKEGINLELRVSAFNATNTWLSGGPNMSDPADPNFGKVLGTDNPATSARVCEYQMRINF